MLGHEHVLSTVAIAITIIYIVIFQKFLTITGTLTLPQVITDVVNLPTHDYMYLALFFIAMIIASTAPDIDVEQPEAFVKKRKLISSVWFTTVKYIAYLPMASLFSFSKNKQLAVGHRKIFHSLYGAVAYTISIVIIFVIILSLLFFVIRVLENPSNIPQANVSTIGNYVKESILTIKHYWNFVLAFLLGSFLGFIAHLFEDSLTVSGIVYLPFITNLGLKGRLRTGTREFYSEHNIHFFKKSRFGMIMIWIFNILFIIAYTYYKLYLLTIFDVAIIYLVSGFIFLSIFTGMRPAFLNRE